MASPSTTGDVDDAEIREAEGKEQRLERAALTRVLSSMYLYKHEALVTPIRWERCAAALAERPTRIENALGHSLAADEMKRMAASARECIERNYAFLNMLAGSYTGCFGLPDAGAFFHAGAGAENASRVRYLFRNLVRDWSEEGRAEREQSYGRMIKELQRHLPPTTHASRRSRVLVCAYIHTYIYVCMCVRVFVCTRQHIYSHGHCHVHTY